MNTALLLLALVMKTSVVEKKEEKTKVVVIGAGFSGLSVAYHLPKDLYEVTILEARDRVGGRVHPFDLSGDDENWVDLGGRWVHEASELNPIRRLIEDLEIPFQQKDTTVARPTKRKDRFPVFTKDGERIDQATQKSASKFFYRALDVDAVRYEHDPTFSFQNLLDDQMNHAQRFSSPKFRQMVDFLRHRTECYEGGRLRELSVLLSEMYQSLKGPDEVVQGGYRTLLNEIVEKLRQDGTTIKLDSPVECIRYSRGKKDSAAVTVQLCDGTVLEQAHYCVCTVPLGVLQQRCIRFEPDLSDHRWRSIDSIGMGLLDKIVLKFPHKFWGSFEGFGVLDEDPSKIKVFGDETSSERGGDGILVLYHGGDVARRIYGDDGLTDEECIKEVMETLHVVFDKAPNPLAYKVTRWLTDPYAYGAYSFTKVGCTQESYEEVGSPIGNLLFAGEHTSTTSHSTVHGAWQTGAREAQRLMVKHSQ